MRLDKYLKVSRIIKRRTVAAEAADAGRITVNGKVAKPSTNVEPGAILEIAFGTHSARYEVLACPESAGKAGAAEMYRELKEQ